MIYIDTPPHTQGWSHLFADSVPELHAFARKFSVKRHWYHNRRGRYQPHYDVRSFRVPAMVAAGAVLVSWRSVPAMLRERYAPEQRIHMNIGGAMATFTRKPSQETIQAVEHLVEAVMKMEGTKRKV